MEEVRGGRHRSSVTSASFTSPNPTRHEKAKPGLSRTDAIDAVLVLKEPVILLVTLCQCHCAPLIRGQVTLGVEHKRGQRVSTAMGVHIPLHSV